MNKKQNTNYEIRSTKKKSVAMRHVLRISYFVFIAGLLSLLTFSHSSCNIYKFHDYSFPDSIKTVKVNIFENKATYVNPQLSPRLADRLRQKITSQTRMNQTNSDKADWIIDGTITNYSFTTSGVTSSPTTGKQESTDRLTVGVHIKILDQRANTTKENDVSRSFEFSASQSIQQAEAALFDDILRGITDDIFNKIFSTW
ncbi:MAG: LptE family protein [Chitinophagaceae bacterium]